MPQTTDRRRQAVHVSENSLCLRHTNDEVYGREITVIRRSRAYLREVLYWQLLLLEHADRRIELSVHE